MMKRFVFFLLFYICSLPTFAQDYSNKGKEFWIAYSSHIDEKASVMGIYITSDKNATGNISINGTNIPFTVIAKQITRKFIGNGTGFDGSNSYVYLDMQDGIKTNAAIKITSDIPIVVYAHIIRSARSAATLALPTQVLGTEYIIPSHQSTGGNAGTEQQGIGMLSVVATQSNTVIEINPTIAGRSGKPANTPFQVTLVNAGDCYQFHGVQDADISGTTVKSISTSSTGCKPIAVFSATTWSAFDCTTPKPSGGDNLYQELFPVRSWGKQFITAPFKNRNYDIYRVFVKDPTTVVTLTDNGVSQVMGGAQYNAQGKFYEHQTSNPVYISADKPISVVEYITSTTCKTGCATGGSTTSCYADPEMVLLNPIEQTLKDVTFFSAHQNFVPSGQSNVVLHFVNLIISTKFKNTVKIDGASPKGTFITIPTTGYSYLQEDLTTVSASNPVHNVTADTGFSAIVYGYGNVESYGYNGGTNIVDLYQYVTLQNQYATVNFPAACKSLPFQFSITLPYQPLKMNWDFFSTPNLSPNLPYLNNAPVYDSTFVKDGKSLYVYKVPGTYVFNQIGTYNVKVTVNNPSSDGCIGDQEIYYQVEVFNPPLASFNINTDGCISTPITFTDNSQTSGRSIIKWAWDFGDGTKDSIANPSKFYSSGGIFPVKYTIITDVGCISDTIKNITLNTPPTAKFTVSDTLCMGSPVKFTDASTANSNTITKWYWDFGNGLKDTSYISNNPIVYYADTGNYVVTLILETSTGCRSIAFTKTVYFRSTPVVDFVLPDPVCFPGGIAAFINLTTINDGTAASLKYNWNFGDGHSSSLQNPTNIYTSTGPYTIYLTATSSSGCSKTISKILSTFYPQPKADFNVKTEICLRDTSIFTDLSNGNGSNITKWFWSFGDGTTDTTQSPKHLYTAAKSDTAKLYFYTVKGCVSDTMTKIITVNSLPIAGFTVSNPVCEKRAIKFTDTSKANVGTITQWGWNMGNGHVYTQTTLSNPFTETYDTTGNYQVKLMVINSKGCKSDSTLPVTITTKPLPHIGFILPEVCLDDAFAPFTDTSKIADASQGQFIWNWTFGDPNATIPANPNYSTQQNPTHKYSDTGVYKVKLLVTSKDFCNDSLTQSFTVNGSTPKANFIVLNSNKLCSNDSVRIKNTSTVDFGNITKLEIYWDTVNNPTYKTVDNDPKPNKVYANLYNNFALPSTKDVYVKLMAYSGVSCVNPKTVLVTLHQSPKVQFLNIAGICNDTTPRIISEASEPNGVPGITFFTGSGITNNNTGLFNPQLVAPGVYPIKYTYTSNTYGCIDSATKNITVWKSPTAKLGVGYPLCEKNDITFIDSSIANLGSIVKWNWDFGNGNTTTNTSNTPFTFKYPSANTYFVSLKVTTDSGCHNTIAIPIKINYLPKVYFGLPSICLPDGKGKFLDSSTIANNSSYPFTYLWNFDDSNDPTPSTLQNPVHQYSSITPANIKLVVTSKDGCKDSLSRLLTTIYPQPKASFTIAPDTTICFGDELKFKDISAGITSNPTKWNWDLGFGYTSTQQHPTQTYSDSGTATVSLHIYNAQNCVSDTFKRTIIVNPYPIIQLPQTLTFLQNGLLTIKPIYYFGHNLSYLWTPNQNILSDTVLNAQVFPDDDKRYFLKITGAGNCSDTASVNVVVLKLPKIPNVFSPNGDGVNDTWVIEHLESYPGCTVQVFDRYGKQVYVSLGYSRSWNGKSNGKELPTGTYYYIIYPRNGRQPLSGSITILR